MYKHIVSYSIFVITLSAHGAYGQDQALLLPFFLPLFLNNFFQDENNRSRNIMTLWHFLFTPSIKL